jgi:predicted dehydrogenase
MIHAIEHGHEPLVTAEDGKKALEMILAIYKSAAEGTPVRFPLAECSTLDSVGRFG